MRFRNGGFSLVGVLIATGVMSILALLLMQIMQNSIQGQVLMRAKQSATNVQMAAIGVLSTRTICELNFQNVSTNPAAPDVITRLLTGVGVTLYQEGQNYDQNMVQLRNLTLKNFKPYATAGNDLYRGTMDLVLDMTPVSQPTNLLALSRTVNLAVELNGYPPASPGPADGIRTCIAVGNEVNDIWKVKANGDIYYTGFNVGIGTNAPAQLLHVNGNIWATTYLHLSDRRLKEDIRPSEGLAIIEKIEGVRFIWKNSGKPALGLIAQNVEQTIPEAVATNPANGEKSVDYDQLMAPIVESIKELARHNDQLEQRLRQTRAQIKQLTDVK